jgi:hypothetical protein
VCEKNIFKSTPHKSLTIDSITEKVAKKLPIYDAYKKRLDEHALWSEQRKYNCNKAKRA